MKSLTIATLVAMILPLNAMAETVLKFSCDDEATYELVFNPRTQERSVRMTGCWTLPESDPGFCIRMAGFDFQTWSARQGANVKEGLYILSGTEFTDEFEPGWENVSVTFLVKIAQNPGASQFERRSERRNIQTGEIQNEISALRCRVLTP